MKRRECIIFDMDGVLVLSEAAMKAASIQVLKEYGVDAGPEDFLEFTGMGEDMFIGGVARKYGADYHPAMKDAAYSVYAERAAEEVLVFPGVREGLARLKVGGYRLCVASAADLVKVNINLKCIGCNADFFDAVVTGSDITNKKPDPEVFLKAAELAETEPADCIVVEDALAGIAAARAAGMRSIGVATAFDSVALYAAGADHVVARFLEVYPTIKDWTDAG